MPTEPEVRCTWAECREPARHSCLNREGVLWACLCDGHKAELDAAFAAVDFVRLRTCWAQARAGLP